MRLDHTTGFDINKCPVPWWVWSKVRGRSLLCFFVTLFGDNSVRFHELVIRFPSNFSLLKWKSAWNLENFTLQVGVFLSRQRIKKKKGTPGYWFSSKSRFRRRSFYEPNLIHWIKYMKSSGSESIRNASFNLERLSCSFRPTRPGISPLERLWNEFDSNAKPFMHRT